MFRHVVIWNLNAETPAERDSQAAEITAALLGLREQVPQIVSLTVDANRFPDETNGDLLLVADFDDEAGFRAYCEHPAHIAVSPLFVSSVARVIAIDVSA